RLSQPSISRCGRPEISESFFTATRSVSWSRSEGATNGLILGPMSRCALARSCTSNLANSLAAPCLGGKDTDRLQVLRSARKRIPDAGPDSADVAGRLRGRSVCPQLWQEPIRQNHPQMDQFPKKIRMRVRAAT